MIRTTNTMRESALPKLALLTLGFLLMAVVFGCGSSSQNETTEHRPPVAPAAAAPAAPAPQSLGLPPQAPASPAQPRPAAPAPAAAPAIPVPAQAAAPAPSVTRQRAAAPASESTTSAPVDTQMAYAAPAPTAAPAAPASQALSGAAAAPAAAPQSGGGPPTHPGVPPQDRRWGRQYKQQTPSATTFEDYQRSRFAWTEDDAVSTFSLDTDRTSYHLALNWARSGYEVDPDSVRAEEWVNSFDYGYDMPSNRDSFAMSTDVMKHPLQESTYLVRLGFQAPDLRDDKPLNVTLVLDASGSMGDGNRVDIAREAAETIRRSLGKDDRIAVVHFTTDVIHDYTVEHQRPGRGDVQWSVSQLAPHGSTNVQAGLDLGVQMAHRIRRERPDAYNYIILMSDGVANVDATDPFAILESASDRDSGTPLRLITVGVGISNYNDYLLEQLAQHGNGWYRYLSTTAQARATFSRENWLALSVPFADQTRAQVTWDPAMVASWRLIGYENRVTSDESFTENRREFAEIPVGAATTVFYEIELTHEGEWAAESKLVEIGDVALRWVTPADGTSNRQQGTILADLSSGSDPLTQFGALVALASDRYSSLPYIDGRESGYVRHDLSALNEDLRLLEYELGKLDSYRDFTFLLNHLTDSLPESMSSTKPSGYSQ